MKGTRLPDIEALNGHDKGTLGDPRQILPEVHGGMAEEDGEVY